MDDLISRQAAIDAAIEATDSWEGFCSIGRQKRIENYINSLPFAPGMDCISRRAAIDICANVIDLFRGQFGAGVLVAIKESIEELPSALSTNLAEVSTDMIFRWQAIDAIRDMQAFEDDNGCSYLYLDDVMAVFTDEEELPSAQSEIIRCRNCRYYNSEEKECLDLLGHGRRWEEDDFCSYGVKMEEVTS